MESEIMDSYNVGDGYIHIQENQECRYQVEFENHLAPADVITGLEHGTLNILITRGHGASPDTVMIYDNLTRVTYTMIVEDNTTGKTCVPWLLMS
jgi:hypothetical protein